MTILIPKYPNNVIRSTTIHSYLHKAFRTAWQIAAAGKARVTRIHVRIDQPFVEPADGEFVEYDLQRKEIKATNFSLFCPQKKHFTIDTCFMRSHIPFVIILSRLPFAKTFPSKTIAFGVCQLVCRSNCVR